MNGRRWLILAAIAVAVVQIGVLFSMIAGRAAILRDGREVVLEVRPIDPRDLLRGDYIVLDYNISTISAALLGPAQAAAQTAPDKTLFVRLKADDAGIWQPIAARYGAKPEPAAGEGEVDIRGVAGNSWRNDSATISVNYGIERFYVPEGEGRAIERNINVRAFRMKVAVAADGAAQIKSFHDGETMLYAEPLY